MRPIWLSLALMVACLWLSAGSAQAESFASSAEVALIEDYDSAAVLYEKNADQPTQPGSTTKLLTAEVVFHELKEGHFHLDDTFEVSEKAWREGGAHAHGPAMFLAVKSHVRIEDLLRGLIIQSGADAAMTLAEGIAGSEATFVEMMNKRAAEIGMAIPISPIRAGRSIPPPTPRRATWRCSPRMSFANIRTTITISVRRSSSGTRSASSTAIRWSPWTWAWTA